MSDDGEPTQVRERDDLLTLDRVRQALNLVVYEGAGRVDKPGPPCDWPRLCSKTACWFPHYFRDGEPTGLIAHTLIQLGYPVALLKDLDVEYEMGEVIHPGVKIYNSRNVALLRIEPTAMKLLGWLQDRRKSGMTWGELHCAAFTPYRVLGPFDRKRRPWLY